MSNYVYSDFIVLLKRLRKENLLIKVKVDQAFLADSRRGTAANDQMRTDYFMLVLRFRIVD